MSNWQTDITSLFTGTCSDRNFALLSLAHGIECRNLKLCDVIEHMQDQLISPEKEDRRKSLALIVDILKKVQKDFFNSQEASLLCDFLCDRLKDHYTLISHALQGLIYIGQLPQLESNKVPVILHALLNNVHNQSQRQEDRHLFYTFVYNCITLRTDDLKVMDNELVSGFIRAMEGEKDPRNLLIVFQIIPLITKYYTLAPFAEELFEVIGCYFPIEFKPINKSGQTVTEEDLVVRLRRCLACTSDFAEFCLPLLVEKLSSSVQSAKLESLLTLEACTLVYPTAIIDQFFPDIWASIKEEVFNSAHEATVLAAICTIGAIIKSDVASVQSNTRNTATAHLETILKDCAPHLNEPNNKLMMPNAKILQAVAKSSNTACVAISHVILPILLHNANMDDQKRVPTIRTLIEFLNETKSIAESDKETNTLFKHKSALVVLFQTCALSSNAELSFEGLRGQETIITVKDLLNEQELVSISEAIFDIALNTTDEKLKDQALKTLSVFAATNGELTSRCIVSKHTECLLHMPFAGCEKLLQTLVAVSVERSKAKSILSAILQFVTASLKVPGVESTKDIAAALKAMSEICTRVNLADDRSEFLSENVVNPLLNMIEELLPFSKNVADLLRATIPYLNTTQSSLLAEFLVSSFLSLTNESLEYIGQKIQILEGVISSVPNKTAVPQMESVAARMINLCCEYQDVSEICARCLCSLVNKAVDDQILQHLLDQVSQILDMKTQQQPNLLSPAIFQIWIWLTKGLLMRGYDQVEKFVFKVTDFLHQDLDTNLACKFRILTEDIPEMTTANVRMLYKQRLFLLAYPRLVINVGTGKKLNHIVALAALVDCLPMQAIQSELPNILSALMEGLVVVHDVEMTEALMRTVGSLLESTPLLFIPHLGHFITHCLRLSSSANSMVIRMSTLRCLAQTSTSLPVEHLLPHRDKVILGLLPCLDDKKRLVRKCATQARTKWYLVGSPGGFNA